MSETSNNYSWWLDVENYESSAWIDGVLQPDEIKLLTDSVNAANLQKATVEGMPTDGVRSSKIKFLESNNPEFEWVFRRMTDVILDMNSRFFKFDLHQIQNLQYTVYGEGEYYVKHIDMLYSASQSNHRKLSFSVQLSDPDSYEGGDLLIHHSAEPFKATRKQGSAIFFPGYALHEVTPVTKGVRHSLVGWVIGPRLR